MAWVFETFIAENAGVQAVLVRQLFLQIDGSQVSLPESFKFLKHAGRINEALLLGGLFNVIVNGDKGEREVRSFISIKGFPQQREGLHDGFRLLVYGRPCTCLVDAQEPQPGSCWRLFRGDTIGFGKKALSFTRGGTFSLVIALVRHGRIRQMCRAIPRWRRCFAVPRVPAETGWPASGGQLWRRKVVPKGP